ncbi:hypothetical protein [Janthinobacterium sp. HLX7-2]|uniref:hypothetical protein n=1 Tax=Janthinobacterium sp. HLX7-2 TaxID=1259331 RepID=UPI003F26E70B
MMIEISTSDNVAPASASGRAAPGLATPKLQVFTAWVTALSAAQADVQLPPHEI